MHHIALVMQDERTHTRIVKGRIWIGSSALETWEVATPEPETLMLLDVSEDAPKGGEKPVFFAGTPDDELLQWGIIELTPERFEEAKAGGLLPQGWKLCRLVHSRGSH